MSNHWKEWEDHLLDEKFPLFRYLGGSEQCAVFLTERQGGGRTEKAAIKIVASSPENVDVQLIRWRQSRKLSHPHLIPLYESGRFELSGEPFAYVVMECAEENLGQVLPSRALTAAEAREMTDSVLAVLTYLHREGFVHGHIHPGNIMASGDQLKVSSDALYRVAEPLAGNNSESPYDPPEYTRGDRPGSRVASTAGDVWSLGTTLFETLTQRLPDEQNLEQRDAMPAQPMPEPFFDIARHCLIREPQARWSIPQIAARLEGRVQQPKVQAIRPEARTFAVPSRPVPQPAPQPVDREPIGRPKRRSYTMPIAVACALVLVALVGGTKLLHHHANTPEVPVATAEAPPAPSAPVAAPPNQQEHSTKPGHGSSKLTDQGGTAAGSPAAVPALAHPDALPKEETDTVAKFPAASPGHGAVMHQEPPEILQSAKNSIRGTVRVSVKVNVDRSGNVEDARLESRGPSRYFARVALQAAQGWKFRPPTIGGQGVLSTWTLRYEFTRNGASVLPTQDLP